MAEEQPSLHIDTDWKKQAQEEKRRLAEKAAQEAQSKAPVAAGAPVLGAGGMPADPRGGGGGAPAGARGARGGGRERRELPPASIATLAQSLMTQALYYLGDLAYQGGDPVTNLDMAKHQIDTLAVLEEKTGDKLSEEERHALDQALYETRSRFVSIASQFI
jgi:hypothetical protein